MDPLDLERLRADLPELVRYPYYADREAGWLTVPHVGDAARISDLRAGPAGRFLSRGPMRPVVAQCGGVLRGGDLAALTDPLTALGADDLRPAALAGLEAVFDLHWHDFEVTFATWGIGASGSWAQMSRPGGNLVLQLGFPREHGALMARHGASRLRKRFEFARHPIRQTGAPTLAWARLDIDPDTGSMLIEEVQSDWLRFARELVAGGRLPDGARRRVAAYEAGLRDRYGRIWPRALLLCVLELARDLMGVREVWMHSPEGGVAHKSIWPRCAPPVSLYSSLPKSFGFAPTDDPPPFLARRHRRTRRRLARDGVRAFWHLDLTPPG